MGVQEVQRDHDGVVERGVPSADRTCLDPLCRRLCRDLLGEHRVILRRHRDFGRAELCKAARCLLVRCNVKVVGVHDRMGAGDYHGIGLKIGGLLDRAFVRVARQLDFLFLALADLRQEQRRMGQNIGGNDGHGNSSSRALSCSDSPSSPKVLQR